MNIRQLPKALLLFTFALASIYFVKNTLQNNKPEVGVVLENNLAAFQNEQNITAIIYGKSTCPFCTKAIASLELNNISYRYKNIKESPQALQEFSELKGRAIPLLITRELRITGFNETWFTPQVLLNNQLPIKAGINKKN